MFERFTDRSRRVVALAQDEARLLGHNYIGTEHLLLAMVHEAEGQAGRVLTYFDITLEELREEVRQVVGVPHARVAGQMPFTPRAKKSLELALREALHLGHGYIGTEHLLLGLLKQDDTMAMQLLGRAGLQASTVRDALLTQMQHGQLGPITLDAKTGRLVMLLDAASRADVAEMSKLDPSSREYSLLAARIMGRMQRKLRARAKVLGG